MTRNQYLLLKLAEECNEVAQRALKQAQFGKNEIQPNLEKNPEEKNNAYRLYEEVVDLETVIRMLTEAGEMERVTFEQELRMSRAKRKKIEKYFRYSHALGMVESDEIQYFNPIALDALKKSLTLTAQDGVEKPRTVCSPAVLGAPYDLSIQRDINKGISKGLSNDGN